MTEFAFSGLGLNLHYGTLANPFDRKGRRIPGGSSSGAAVSYSDGMALSAIGTDTGGSVRIPAALCGLVSFKPTARRILTSGTLPLSSSLDSIGPLAASVRCCRILGDCALRFRRPGHWTMSTYMLGAHLNRRWAGSKVPERR
jgi:aspartyl-tRNA(Asn)/glutamyl-tRNA(Gln) amidotransferase subunit A